VARGVVKRMRDVGFTGVAVDTCAPCPPPQCATICRRTLFVFLLLRSTFSAFSPSFINVFTHSRPPRSYAHGVVAAFEYVRPTRPRAEAPGRRTPGGGGGGAGGGGGGGGPAARGYGMKGRVDSAAADGSRGGRAGQRVRGAAAARLVRSQRGDDDDDDDDGDDDGDNDASDEE
jgi:hypothetical protein